MYFNRVTMKDLKSFLPKVNFKLTTAKLREYFQEIDTSKRNEMNFDDFSRFYYKILIDSVVSY